ncbi:DoxX family membrane protein [Cellulosimicrobium protaetiae]|uniref:DoxX family membrane protein n=1 Tax=Cellulosimicrobium protaetiae TaxID=2587808 RepID=A0A6M5UEV7_9MICO|nr:DoxX family membrane protein [Cellulosimicrobium protaetiae]QJW36152.1 DoxX family membrane protein [Cellulosimicrobium protaetiae]
MLLRHLARPMLASWFVYDGVQAALKPAEHVRAARSGVELVEKSAGIEAPLSEKQVTALVRAHGAATAVAGLFLAVGKAPRTAALTLAALTVPLAVVNQPFTSGEATRAERTRKFVANVGAIGAALIAGADYEGRPGVQWRLEKARHDLALARQAKQGAVVAGTKGAVKDVSSSVRGAAKEAGRSTKDAAKEAARSARRATKAAQEAAEHAASLAAGAVHDAEAAVRAKVA